MFGLFKKKEKVVFSPSFGNAEDFVNLYCGEGEECVTIGYREDHGNINIATSNHKTNNITIINDRKESIRDNCVAPILKQRKFSYVVYDPTGEYYERLSSKLETNGYETRLIDICDNENWDRIDLFETANITKNPYWTSILLAGSIGCETHEIFAAHSLFMAMMRYLLEKTEKINIIDMYDLFIKIKNNDKQILSEMRSMLETQRYIDRAFSNDPNITKDIFEKIQNNLFKTAIYKANNPNIFTVTAHKKKTALFIKKVPYEYQYLITALMFNLKASSILCSHGKTSVFLIDSAADEWYKKKLLDKICDESGMKKGVANILIRDKIDIDSVVNEKPILVYMHSNNDATKEFVYNYLTVNSIYSQEEKNDISKRFFKGKPLSNEVLSSSPINIEMLNDFDDSVVIDTSMNAKPFIMSKL